MGATVAYMRVSSRAQDLGMQRAAIEKLAAARGDTIKEWLSFPARENRTAYPTAAPRTGVVAARVAAASTRL